MPKRSRKPSDINKLAQNIMEQATSQISRKKNPAAVSLGHLGGLKGGPARAKSLSARKRREIAIKAAIKRWAKKGS
jgi:hypothetical protein